MIKEGDIPILSELVQRLEAAFVGMKQAYSQGNLEGFNRMKRELIGTQKRILEVAG